MKNKIVLKLLIFISFTLVLLLLCECSVPGGDGGTSSITVSWDSNNETLVNSPGGGYRVYYSRSSGFLWNDPVVFMKEVPYVSGPQAPTSTELLLENDRWDIRIVAYIDLNGECVSLPSKKISINLP